MLRIMNVCTLNILEQVLNSVYEIPENGTDVSKHVAAWIFVIRAYVWAYKEKF